MSSLDYLKSLKSWLFVITISVQTILR